MKRKSRSIWERLPSYIEEHIFKMGASQPPSVVGIIYITFGTFQMSVLFISFCGKIRGQNKNHREIQGPGHIEFY